MTELDGDRHIGTKSVAAVWPAPALAWYSLAVLILAVILGFVNKQIIVLLVEPIKSDLALNDLSIGIIVGLGPALLAALIGYPLAWLADRRSRRALLIGSVFCWSVATAACGLANSFGSLLIASIGIAIGEAALIPIVYSLIPDLFAANSRDRANFIFYGATIVGGGFGLILSGAALAIVQQIQTSFGSPIDEIAAWRLAFLLVACPGIVLILLILPLPDSRRVRSATSLMSDSNNERLLPFVRRHRATMVLIYSASGFYSLALGGFAAWLAPAVIRQMGAEPSSTGLAFGAAFSTGSIMGVVIAVSTAHLWKKVASTGYPVRALKYAMALSLLPASTLLAVNSPAEAFLIAGVLFAIAVAGTAYSPTLYQNMATPELRARIIALGTIIFASMGATGPLIIGAISDALADTSVTLLQAIVTVSVPSFFLAAVLFHFAERPFVKTMNTIESNAITQDSKRV